MDFQSLIGQIAAVWMSTSAITSIAFSLAFGNWFADSTFTLYGEA